MSAYFDYQNPPPSRDVQADLETGLGMKTQHTRGPWSVTPRFGHFIDVIHHSREKGAITLALCRVQARATWRDEAEANARLIAAAGATK